MSDSYQSEPGPGTFSDLLVEIYDDGIVFTGRGGIPIVERCAFYGKQGQRIPDVREGQFALKIPWEAGLPPGLGWITNRLGARS